MTTATPAPVRPAAVPVTGQITAPDGTPLHTVFWAAPNARAGVVLAHGYAEHCGRYTGLAESLVAAGISLFAYDFRGHGRSGGVRAFVHGFREYLDDTRAVLEVARAKMPGKLFLFGHSQGGLVALRLLADSPGLADGLIVSNPALTNKVHVPAWKVAMAHAASRLKPTLALPSGLEGKDMSRDPANARAYETDPLNCKLATARWYTEFLAAQGEVLARPRDLRNLPLLALIGTGDKVIDSSVTEAFFRKVDGPDLTVHLYPGFFHELLNEPKPDRDRVLADAHAWLDARLADGAPTAA